MYAIQAYQKSTPKHDEHELYVLVKVINFSVSKLIIQYINCLVNSLYPLSCLV